MSDFNEDKYKFSTKTSINLVLDDIVERREQEIKELRDELLEYKIFIKDLVYEEPSYTKRNKLLNISYFIIEDSELFEYLIKTKKFPINMITNRTPIEKEFFQEWKEYIITYVLILSNPNYKYLQEYIEIVQAENIFGKDEIFEDINKKEHIGIIVNKGILNSIILTSKGEFIKVRNKGNNSLGEEVVGIEAITFRKYKLQISLLLSFVLIIFTMGVFQYKSIDKTIVVETTSKITLEVNKFNKVIDSYTVTEKGIEMLSKLNIKNSNIDDLIKDILNYSMDNEMIPDEGILITVTGKPLKYEALENTEKFIKENKIEVKFNNSGNENKVSP